MKSSVRVSLGVMIALISSGAVWAAPVQLAQNLPPMQGTYPNSGFTNYGNTGQSYNQPQYGAQQQYNQPSYGGGSLQGYVGTAPAGSVVAASISSPISSEFARVGDTFTVSLSSPLVAANSVLLPAGTQVQGQVAMVRPAGRSGKNGELEIRFTTAMLANGQRIPLSAKIQTTDNTGVLKGGTTGGRTGRAAMSTGIGAGLGAALGTAMGPLSGGGVGRGAIYGTTLGAGAGLLGAAWQKGKPAVISSGDSINLVLDQPLTVSPSGDSGYQQPQYNQQQPYNY